MLKILKFFNQKRYISEKNAKNKSIWHKKYVDLIHPEIKKNSLALKNKSEISFLHSGQIGDIINSLALVKKISEDKTCNFYLEVGKPMPKDVNNKHKYYSQYFISKDVSKKLVPLLKRQKFIKKIEIYENQEIDINLNFFREMYSNFNIDSVRWYFHLTGIHANLNESYIDAENHKNFKNFITIMRSSRRQNDLINYKFLNKYDDIIFLGLKSEYIELKKDINNLHFYDCRDFLELAMILKNSKVFIGNLSFGYALAEALKIPRLLESGPNFPLVYPNGRNGYDFYHQEHFEGLFDNLYNKKD